MYDNLVHCKVCKAKYTPGVWYRTCVIDPESTATQNQRILGKIDENTCPICGAEEDREEGK